MAKLLSGGLLRGNVNGTLVEFLNGTNSVFGDRLNLGRRFLLNNALDGRVWDGCLAHFPLYNKTLSSEEMTLWMSFVADDHFLMLVCECCGHSHSAV
jgi:hypothetical protein